MKLTPIQQLMYEQFLTHPTILMGYQIETNIEPELFLQALQILITFYPSLSNLLKFKHNLSFFADKNLAQMKPPYFYLEMYDVIDNNNDNKKVILNTERLQEKINKNFDLNNELPWRVYLVKHRHRQFSVVFVFHPVLIEFSFTENLLRELNTIYLQLTGNKNTAEPTPKMNAPRLLETSLEERLNFWKKQLDDVTSTALPHDYVFEKKFDVQTVNFPMAEKDFIKLEWLSKKFPTDVQTVMLALWLTTLYRFTHEKSICIALTTPYVDREMSQETTNLIPFKFEVEPKDNFPALLLKVITTIKIAQANQIPVNILASSLFPIANRFPFKIVCQIQTVSSPIVFNHAYAQNIPFSFSPLLGDLRVQLNCTHTSAEININYNPSLFKKESILNLLQHYQFLLQQNITQLELSIDAIPFITPITQHLLNIFNATHDPHPIDYVHQLFSRTAREIPKEHFIHFIDEDGKSHIATYEEIEKKSDALAAYLMQTEVKQINDIENSQKIIGVCLKRSINAFVVLLAALKANFVFVPIDYNFEINDNGEIESLPKNINDYLLNVIIADKDSIANINRYKNQNSVLTKINIDDPGLWKTIRELNLHYVPPKFSPDDLAYIIYTSGSTGRPKGVQIMHGPLMNLANAISKKKTELRHFIYAQNGREHKDKKVTRYAILGVAPLTFDAFFWDFLQAIIFKGPLFLVNDKERLNPFIQIDVINKHKITHATLLPVSARNLDTQLTASLEHVVVMGATPDSEVLRKLQDAGIFTENAYGPSEATIGATNNGPYFEGKSFKVIGVPNINTQIFVLHESADGNLYPCPVNVIGAAYIAGPLAKRYVGNEELTNQKFIYMNYEAKTGTFSPLDNQPGQKRKRITETALVKVINPDNNNNAANIEGLQTIRLYKTGDLMRYIIENGKIVLEFIGRNDAELKFCGVRVDAGEVEHNIRQHPNVRDLYLVPNSNKRAFYAYIVHKNPQAPILKYDLDLLLKKIPHIPQVARPRLVLAVDAIPVTKNGKVDTNALTLQNYFKPHGQFINQLHKELAHIWRKCLYPELENDIYIDPNISFSDLGGNSVDLGEIIVTMKKVYEFDIKCIHLDMKIVELSQFLKARQTETQQFKLFDEKLSSSTTAPPSNKMELRYK